MAEKMSNILEMSLCSKKLIAFYNSILGMTFHLASWNFALHDLEGPNWRSSKFPIQSKWDTLGDLVNKMQPTVFERETWISEYMERVVAPRIPIKMGIIWLRVWPPGTKVHVPYKNQYKSAIDCTHILAYIDGAQYDHFTLIRSQDYNSIKFNVKTAD